MNEFGIPLYALLDVWMALGGEPLVFDKWMSHPKRTPADAWAQLMGAVENDLVGLLEDANPPADELLTLVEIRVGP